MIFIIIIGTWFCNTHKQIVFDAPVGEGGKVDLFWCFSLLNRLNLSFKRRIKIHMDCKTKSFKVSRSISAASSTKLYLKEGSFIFKVSCGWIILNVRNYLNPKNLANQITWRLDFKRIGIILKNLVCDKKWWWWVFEEGPSWAEYTDTHLLPYFLPSRLHILEYLFNLFMSH